MSNAEVNEEFSKQEIGEVRRELRTAFSALRDLRELTKASTHHTTEAGSPDFTLFHLPKDGGLRTRGIAILERVDRILGKVEPEKEGGGRYETSNRREDY